MMKTTRKLLALLLAGVMTASLLAGCSSSPSTSSSGSGSSSGETVEGEKIFRRSTLQQATNMNPHQGGDAGSIEVSDYVQAKLYRVVYNEDKTASVPGPELAASEPTTEDGYTWTIKLDPNAKWANGEPITADDFMYSWEMALNPQLANTTTSGLAKNHIQVENAYEYYMQLSTGVPVEWEDVGFKKVDDLTLTVTTSEKYSARDVMYHFCMRYTGPVYKEMYEAGMDANRTSTTYGTSAEEYMSSGPFKLDTWVKGTEVTMSKNENYCHADEIILDGMTVRTVPDENTQIQLFQNGEIDYLSLGTNGLEVFGEDPRTQEYPSTTLRSIQINTENPDKPYLGNLNFKKALYYGINREELANALNYIPAAYFLPTPYVAYSDGTLFRDIPEANAYIPENNGYDPDLAKELFDKALEETGVDKVSITVIYSETVPALRTASEYIQNELTQLFGADRFELKLQSMAQSALLDIMRSSQSGPTNTWDLGWSAWDLTAAQLYPNRKFEPYTSTDSRRFAPYNSPELDALYAESISEECRLDEKKRIEVTMEMEKLVIDNVLEIPVYQQQAYVIHSDRCILPSDVRVNTIGWGWAYMDIDLTK